MHGGRGGKRNGGNGRCEHDFGRGGTDSAAAGQSCGQGRRGGPGGSHDFDGARVVAIGGRRGTGEQLVYTGETGIYVLTGTAAAPPQLTDPTRGTVTGEALIFNSRDDSVSIEGGGRKTTTVTTAPK